MDGAAPASPSYGGGWFVFPALFTLKWFWVVAAAAFALAVNIAVRRRVVDSSDVPASSEEVQAVASDGSGDERAPGLSFKFEHQTVGATESADEPEKKEVEAEAAAPPPTAMRVHQCRFSGERDFCGFVEEATVMTVHVRQSFADPVGGSGGASPDVPYIPAIPAELSSFPSMEVEPLRKKMIIGEDEVGAQTDDTLSIGFGFVSDDELNSSLSDDDGYSVKDLPVNSDSDCFLSEKESSDPPELELRSSSSLKKSRFQIEWIEDAGRTPPVRSPGNSDVPEAVAQPKNISDETETMGDNDVEELERLQSDEPENVVQLKSIVSDEQESVGDDDVEELEWPESGSPSSDDEEEVPYKKEEDDPAAAAGLPRTDIFDAGIRELCRISEENRRVEEHFQRVSDMLAASSNRSFTVEVEDIEWPEHSGKPRKEAEYGGATEEEEDSLESQWEHQELIDQLKMELRKAKAAGLLPTIMEEAESSGELPPLPEVKPLRLDAAFLSEDPVDQIQQYYKSYRERMRKFDILIYQKKHSIGILKLKDPLHSLGTQKPLFMTVAAAISHSLRLNCRKSADDPLEQFLWEIRCDLETVYVGQMCLSWEFLRWQYERARERPASDPYRTHQYNRVAGEFQQFHVLLQRFIENEAFRGPRLGNYIQSRGDHRNLLQVPIIKEDGLKDRREEQQKGRYSITSDELEEVMEESIRVFWEFVKADKPDDTPAFLKGLVGAPQAELEDPSDRELLVRLHAMLQKKEKRLKDLLKTGNCIVKKLRKTAAAAVTTKKQGRAEKELFFTQVDLRLVARALKMPRITSEQLHWCRMKLELISFSGSRRQINRDDTFLLFPC